MESEQPRKTLKQFFDEKAKGRTKVIFRHVPQAYGAIEPINPGEEKPLAIGTNALAPCIGVYFKLGENSCFVGHFDAEKAETDDQVRALAAKTRDEFKGRILALFPNVDLTHATDLVLTVNEEGGNTALAMAWAVQLNLATSFSPDKTVQAPAVGDMKAAFANFAELSGFGFYAENNTVQRFSATAPHLPEMEKINGKDVPKIYGEKGFTF